MTKLDHEKLKQKERAQYRPEPPITLVSAPAQLTFNGNPKKTPKLPPFTPPQVSSGLICEICKAQLIGKKRLKKHIAMVHTKIKCSKCGGTFDGIKRHKSHKCISNSEGENLGNVK